MIFAWIASFCVMLGSTSFFYNPKKWAWLLIVALIIIAYRLWVLHEQRRSTHWADKKRLVMIYRNNGIDRKTGAKIKKR